MHGRIPDPGYARSEPDTRDAAGDMALSVRQLGPREVPRGTHGT
jgi:hypothetical protein